MLSLNSKLFDTSVLKNLRNPKKNDSSNKMNSRKKLSSSAKLSQTHNQTPPNSLPDPLLYLPQ